jgi:hypothetical protein
MESSFESPSDEGSYDYYPKETAELGLNDTQDEQDDHAKVLEEQLQQARSRYRRVVAGLLLVILVGVL